MRGAESRPRGRLRRSDCSGPGISRRRRGGGFSYLDPEGGRVTDEDTLDRIRELAIPPAWREVWICGDPYGHIQATGLDEAGRKQYLYHERWQLRAAQRKFESMREFASELPRLRRAVKKDLAREGMPRERALACAVRLLDLGFFRIGGEEYAETNESYGVATVLREHVSIEDGEVVSAKDFRTWHGTVLAAVELAREGPPTSKGGGEGAIRAAIGRVAERLGNTPAICRSSYIDPRVLDRFRDGKTIELPSSAAEATVTPRQQGRIERQVLELIE